MTTVERLAHYVGGVPPTDYLEACAAEATALVDRHLGAARDQVPTTVRDRAVLEVAAELYHRKSAPNGIKNYTDMDGTAAVRVARDALVAARPLLAPYLPLAVA